ncbi:hypothetical protein [Sediminibacter sp. Hel_I_10]|uniref:hypothetical protein n=1 Tax=Sediminibacter sp. Hel_I_10 TaxID=1392490 RepID=UPI00047D2107|nr:hypothetical protein [Sediminibacter sp. Hel_I_10]
MRKILILCVLTLSLASCSLDDNNYVEYDTEFVPIESVTIPEEFVFGSTHQIFMTYFRPTSCHSFYDFFYEINYNERTVAVVDIFPIGQQCEVLEEEEVEVSFNFQVNSMEPYVFRFYQGVDETGDDVYYIVEVPVVEE